MAFKLAEIFTEIGVKDVKHKQGLARAKTDWESLKHTASTYGPMVAAGMAVAATAAIGFVKKVVSLANDQERAEKRLEAVLKATGGAAELSADQMKAHAAELQKLTGVSDNAVMGVQAILATFKNLKGDEFKQTTELALDMAAVMGTDAKSSALQLAKALQEPTIGMTYLRRSGVSFTTQQVEMIKKLEASNDLLGAQKIILGEVSSQFGGTARTMGNTFGGTIDKLSERIGDLGEKIGKDLIDNGLKRLVSGDGDAVLTRLENFMTGAGEGAKWIREMANGFETLVDSIKAISEIPGFEQIMWLATAPTRMVTGAIDIGARGAGQIAGAVGNFGAEQGAVRTREEWEAAQTRKSMKRIAENTGRSAVIGNSAL